MPRYKNPQQGTFLDQDGNVIEEVSLPIVVKKAELPQVATQSSSQQILDRTMQNPQSVDGVTNVKKKVKNILSPNVKNINILGKSMDVGIEDPEIGTLNNLVLNIKIRFQWKKRYEHFQVSLHPLSFQKHINRADGEIYYTLPQIKNYKNITKSAGPTPAIYGAKWKFDEYGNIYSFVYMWKAVFKMNEVESCEFHRQMSDLIHTFVKNKYYPLSRE